MLGKTLKVLVTCCLILLLLSIILAVLVIDRSPLVTSAQQARLDQAESVHQLLQEVRVILRKRYVRQRIDVSAAQLNSLVALANRTLPSLTGRTQVRRQHARLLLTYHLPKTPLGEFLNIEAQLQSADGFVLDYVKVGDLQLPGGQFLWITSKLVDYWTQSEIASHALSAVNYIKVTDHNVAIGLGPINPVLEEMNRIKTGLSGTDDNGLRERTAYYLQYMHEQQIARRQLPAQLADFLPMVFRAAIDEGRGRDPVQENKAVILALAVFAGHHRFANLIGDIRPQLPEILPKYRPLLAGRRDLSRHFVISAALHVLSQQGMSVAIGEFKELMDRAEQGSGYSFVDLAADMAGVHFAEQATAANSAWQIQQHLAEGVSESWFFPDTAGLPEGLNKQSFVEMYERVDSPAYQQVVAHIEEKIGRLPMMRVAN